LVALDNPRDACDSAHTIAAAKTHDFQIRAATVRGLLRHGSPRCDIRHEITLDSHSSGARGAVRAHGPPVDSSRAAVAEARLAGVLALAITALRT
jgi:hypothetical protein